MGLVGVFKNLEGPAVEPLIALPDEEFIQDEVGIGLLLL